jgi:hypothetical protein
MTDYKALCAELLAALKAWSPAGGGPLEGAEEQYEAALIVEADAALAQPEPEGLTDEELLEVAAKALGYKSIPSDETCLTAEAGELLAYARAVLARWHRPAIEPVPVSERPWEREGWCDAEGQCWWWCHHYESWVLADGPAHYRLSLPYRAMPVPTTEGHQTGTHPV